MLKQIISNNLFILRYIRNECGFLFKMTFINTFIKRVEQIYLAVFLPAFLLDSIVKGYSFTMAIIVISVYGVFIAYDSLVISYINRITEPTSWNRLYETVQRMLFKKAVQADLKCYDDPTFFDTYVWTMNECDSRIRQSMNTIAGFYGTILSLILNFAIMITLTKISLIFIAISLVITILTQTWLIKLSFKLRQNSLLAGRKNNFIKNVLCYKDYSKEVRATEIKEVLYDKNDENIFEIISLYRKVIFKRISAFFISSFNQVLFLQFGLYIYLAYRITVSGTLSAGSLVAISAATLNAYSILSSLSSTFVTMQENSMYINKFKEFIDYKPEIEEKPNGLNLKDNFNLEIKDICFTYPNTSKPALKNINLSVKSGEKIAIVGYNGSGKTTLIKLIMRFYDPQAGQIFVNENNFKKYNILNYRHSFGVVFQDFSCFSATIAQNILMRDVVNKEEDEKRIWDALKKSGLFEKVNSLPLGIYTTLEREFDENGVVFSGGEMQRLAIARIYARDCKIIVLDEPSSSLDPAMEYTFYSQIFDLFKEKTIIFISHRLATTKIADKIYMFENGSIVEEGTHNQLMSLNMKYAQMYRAQEEKYI